MRLPPHSEDLDIPAVIISQRSILSFLPFLKPKAIQLDQELKAIKTGRSYKGYLIIEPTVEASGGYAVKWFRDEVYPLGWETFIYPLNRTVTGSVKSFVISVSAGKRDELMKRIAKLKEMQRTSFTLGFENDPLKLEQELATTLALGGQREGGSR